MSIECHPITVLPNLSRIFSEYVDRSTPGNAPLWRFFAGSPFSKAWMRGTERPISADRTRLVDALEAQNRSWGAGEATLLNLQRLRDGAHAVVTGQQVGLLGGPLLTLMKAATAVRKAQVATEAGVPHVPIFWMATEDHDLDEVNQAALLGKHSVETLRVQIAEQRLRPVGGIEFGAEIEPVLERAEELLAYAPVCEALRAAYKPGETFGSAFAKFLTHVFREQGLIVIDASGREFHALASDPLRIAIEEADALHEALVKRSAELAAAGYHSQVLVADGVSLLFLVDENGSRLPLRRPGDGSWKAGSRSYTDAELLSILTNEPERLSPNALLRPVFQDVLLPTSMYIGGPAEIAYFAQSEVLYKRILGVMTPVFPRLSATLVEPAIRAVMDKHEIQFIDALTTAEELAQRLGARALPIAGKRAIAAAGNALDEELKSLLEWTHHIDANLGRSAEISASKMRYQMNRIRRLAANFELQKETSLRKHAEAVTLHLYPNLHPQERLAAGCWFLGAAGDGLAQLLVDNAEQECPGHRVIDL